MPTIFKEKRGERERLPLVTSPVDGEERGRGEVVGMREREVRERNFGCKWWKSRRKKKKKRSHWCCWTQAKRRRFARSKRRRFVKWKIRLQRTRTTDRSVTRNDTSFLTYSNDRSSDTYERHVVRSHARATVRATPDDTPFAPRR